MAFMASDDIEFVALNLTAQLWLPFAGNDASTQLHGHLVDFTRRKVELLCDLFLGEIQPHQIEAEHPDPQRSVVSGENRPGQIIEIPAALTAVIPLTGALSVIAPAFLYVPGLTVRTLHPVGPAHLADGLITLVIINQLLQADHDDSMQMPASLSKTFQESQLFSSLKPKLSLHF
jgi:hypothetical protein